jgi:hypothetical protein
MMSGLDPIRELIKSGRKDEAIRQLARLLSAGSENLEAWLLMAQVIDDPARKKDCFEQVLRIDPANEQAFAGLEKTTPPPPSPSSSAPTPSSSGSEPLAGQTPLQDKKSVGDYLTAGSEPRPVGKESVPAYLREIQAVPLEPIPGGASRGSLFDAIDPASAQPPSAPPPIPPGSYRDETDRKSTRLNSSH